MDVRVGGTRLVCMEVQTPDGTMRMWFTGEYRDIVENERLVYTESISDEHGNVLSPSEMGMPDGHPTTTEIAVELEDVDGRTKMVMTHTGIPADSPGAPAGPWRSTSSSHTSRYPAADNTLSERQPTRSRRSERVRHAEWATARGRRCSQLRTDRVRCRTTRRASGPRAAGSSGAGSSRARSRRSTSAPRPRSRHRCTARHERR